MKKFTNLALALCLCVVSVLATACTTAQPTPTPTPTSTLTPNNSIMDMASFYENLKEKNNYELCMLGYDSDYNFNGMYGVVYNDGNKGFCVSTTLMRQDFSDYFSSPISYTAAMSYYMIEDNIITYFDMYRDSKGAYKWIGGTGGSGSSIDIEEVNEQIELLFDTNSYDEIEAHNEKRTYKSKEGVAFAGINSDIIAVITNTMCTFTIIYEEVGVFTFTYKNVGQTSVILPEYERVIFG